MKNPLRDWDLKIAKLLGLKDLSDGAVKKRGMAVEIEEARAGAIQAAITCGATMEQAHKAGEEAHRRIFEAYSLRHGGPL